MLPQEFVNMLLSYPDIFVIFLGDPFQLPPIKKDEGNHLLDNPHVFLSEIMRQEKDNDIIDLTMRIRAGELINPQNGNNVKVFNKKDLNTGMLEWADIIICATNATRNKINKQMRELKGFGAEPCEGEKVICLQNNWDRFSLENTEPLVNGLVGYISNVYTSFNPIPSFFNYSEPSIPTIVGKFVSETGEDYGQITMDRKQFDKGEESLDWKVKYKLGKSKYKSLIPEQFTYGYAVTCHKSQGSQWEKVLVIEEKFPFEGEEHSRWLYTACTRSSDKLVLIRNV
jgi:ATP-dependent exoDNAse (exonuclease V) alpha subunit